MRSLKTRIQVGYVLRKYSWEGRNKKRYKTSCCECAVSKHESWRFSRILRPKAELHFHTSSFSRGLNIRHTPVAIE